MPNLKPLALASAFVLSTTSAFEITPYHQAQLISTFSEAQLVKLYCKSLYNEEGAVIYPAIVDLKNSASEAIVDLKNSDSEATIEYKNSDGTRTDCHTPDYSIEFDFANKWYECLGQSLHYALLNDNLPACSLLLRKRSDEKYVLRMMNVLEFYQIDVEMRLYILY